MNISAIVTKYPTRSFVVFLFAIGSLLTIAFTFLAVSHQAQPAAAQPPEKTIQWIGHPVVSDNRQPNASTGWIGSHQVGLREDGVVVWREVAQPAITIRPVQPTAPIVATNQPPEQPK